MNPRTDEFYTTSRLFKLEGFLKIGFILTTFLYIPIAHFKFIQLLTGFAASGLGLFRQQGAIKLSKDYLIATILSDFGSSMLYLLMLVFLESPSIAFFLPLDIYFSIGASEFLTRGKVEFLLKFEKVKSITHVILTTKEELKKARVYVEVFVFVYLLVLTIMRKVSVLPVLVSFNYLRIRGMSVIGKHVYWTFKCDLDKALGRVPILAKVFGWFFGVLMG